MLTLYLISSLKLLIYHSLSKKNNFTYKKNVMAIKPPEIYLLKRILGLFPILQKNIITIEICKKISFQLALLDLLKPSIATYASKCIENEILMHLRSTKKINQEVSLNEVIGVDKDGSEVVLEDLIDNKEKPILDQIYDADNLQKLIQCFDVLTSKEKDILIKRYGLNSSKKMTQKEIAKEYHISRSYISRIEKRALIKLLKCYLQEKEG